MIGLLNGLYLRASSALFVVEDVTEESSFPVRILNLSHRGPRALPSLAWRPVLVVLDTVTSSEEPKQASFYFGQGNCVESEGRF